MIGFGIMAVFGLITAALAARKGYSFIIWFLAAGIIGLLVLAFLPYANRPEQEAEEQRELRLRGNIIGGALAAAGIAFGIYSALA